MGAKATPEQRAQWKVNHPLYWTWFNIRRRCRDPKMTAYERYGGKGIEVCDRWYDSFDLFLADMGPRPTPTHSVDRINNNGNYTPENCRWATREQQQINRSNTVFYQGKSIPEWAKILGVEYHHFRHYRYRYGLKHAVEMFRGAENA